MASGSWKSSPGEPAGVCSVYELLVVSAATAHATNIDWVAAAYRVAGLLQVLAKAAVVLGFDQGHTFMVHRLDALPDLAARLVVGLVLKPVLRCRSGQALPRAGENADSRTARPSGKSRC